jgi:ferric-dicitrate binding protein FerR (iron transport regulator)
VALRCGRARRLAVGAVGGHASEAERLELEEHLTACAACSAEHQALGLVRRLRDAEPEGLTPAARERVRSALVARPAQSVAQPARLSWPIGVGSALAVAAGVVLWIVLPGHPTERILAGDVAASPAVAGGDRDAVTYRSARGGRVVLGDATTDLAARTEIVWRREDRTVDLHQGRLTVDVQHRPDQHFAVRTGGFTVEVVGTRFEVDAEGVRTERGTVRIVDGGGRTLAMVGAGQSWSRSTPARPPGAPKLAQPPRASAPPEPPGLQPPAPALPEVHAQAATPTERLARARHALGAGRAQEARRLVEPIFHLGRDVAVEARAVYAESFLIEGRYTDAIDGYRVVVRDFNGTPQAESALYAVAQLESEHGRPEEAKAALHGYLARYPRGRFAHEASARLARLAP